MSTHIISKDQNDAIGINENHSKWVVEKGVTVHSDSYYAFFTYDFAHVYSDVDIVIKGSATSSSATAAGIAVFGSNNNIAIGSHGLVKGHDGIYFDSDGLDILNNGKIQGEQTGISGLGDDFRFENHGKIIAGTSMGISTRGGAGTIINGEDGLIQGVGGINHYAYDKSEHINVVNDGTISSTNFAVVLGKASDKLVNHGLIEGWVLMGGGNDRVDLRGGTIDGSVVGGEGNDVYKVSNHAATILELAGGGKDTLVTTVDYLLADNLYIETMRVGGAGDVNLYGNSSANRLIGGAGNSDLYAGAGNDHIFGGAGKDLLSGGEGLDVFVIRKGDGNDTVADLLSFGDHEDTIDLTDFAGIDSFAELQGRMKEVGDNVIIALGKGDHLRIDDVSIGVLTADYFEIFAA